MQLNGVRIRFFCNNELAFKYVFRIFFMWEIFSMCSIYTIKYIISSIANLFKFFINLGNRSLFLFLRWTRKWIVQPLLIRSLKKVLGHHNT